MRRRSFWASDRMIASSRSCSGATRLAAPLRNSSQTAGSRVRPIRESDPELVQELPGGPLLMLEVHADENDSPIAIVRPDRLEQRRLLSARHTSGGRRSHAGPTSVSDPPQL